MLRHSRLEVLNEILALGLLPIFNTPDVETAVRIVSACRAGGCRVVEFTNRGNHATRVFAALAQQVAESDPAVILGVGTILDAPSAAMFIAAGAAFVVGPTLNPEVARLCNRRKVAYIPGCGSVSEISQAEELGVEIVKLFPAGALGGPGFVRAVLGPCPWTRLMPTGGVDASEASIRAWFEAGAACVGMGSGLITKEALAAGDFDAISENVARVLGWIARARGKGEGTCRS